ncbi:MAG: tetratricopeptide repeat protein, partial [Myxococcales bacterium]|nr:tetratricopeptide repeat protein [Myxococcales bacterium]
DLGVALAATGDDFGAMTALRAAAVRLPRSARAHYHYGLASARGGAGDRALRELREAVRLDGTWVDARVALGRALFREGQPIAAADALNEALRQAPDRPGLHYELGRALHLAGSVHAAMEEYRAELRRDPRHPGARERLGLAQAELAGGWRFE